MVKLFRKTFLLLGLFTSPYFVNAQSVTNTYNAGDISTTDGGYDGSCNGPTNPLTVTLPAGGPYYITSVETSYDITAPVAGDCYMSEQRSKIYCQNTATDEGGFVLGVGGTPGTYSYSRNGLTFANGGPYAGGTDFIFEMQAYRTWAGTPGCSTDMQKIDDGTWTVIVNYSIIPPPVIPYPGNVSSNMQLWLKANGNAYSDMGTTAIIDGQSMEQWGDHSANSNNAIQTTANREPGYNDNATDNINYNPSIDFLNTTAGQEDYFELNNATTLPTGNTDRVYYFVGTPYVTPGVSDMFFHGDWTPPNEGEFIGFTLDQANNFDSHFGACRMGSTYINNKPTIYSSYFPVGSTVTTDIEKRINGLEMNPSIVGGGTQTLNTLSVSAYIGGGENSGAGTPNKFWNGKIAEIIVYDADHTSADKNKVDSYLAVKYGITLDNTGGGTIGDYVASNGATTIWDASVTPDYHNDVIGIGRDENSELIQKQSHTIDDTTRIYIDALQATNNLNTGIFSNDIGYVLMGHNQDAMYSTATSITEMPARCGLNSRMEREWKVTKSNFDQVFHIDFKLSPFADVASVDVSHLRLLIDDDGDFANGGTNCYANGDGTGIVITYNNPIITVSNLSNTHILNNSTRYITIGSISSATLLPIDLLEFEAQPINNRFVKLNWETASEINNDYFEIYRSIDGDNWQYVTTLPGAGNSSQQLYYEITDNHPHQGISYYRLKQVDFDGNYSYSEIRKVNLTNINDFTIYPNPANSQVILTGMTTEVENIKIVNVLGQDVTKDVEIEVVDNFKLQVNLVNLSQGLYFFKVKCFNESLRISRVVIKRN